MNTTPDRRCMWAVAMSAFLIFCSPVQAQGRSPAMTVSAAPVEKTPLSKTVTAMGNVVAWREMLISTEASGLAVTEIAVDEGDLVAKGQTLARLNHDRINAEILKQTAAIVELEASLSSARSDLVRARSVPSGVITAQTVEQRETLVKTTEAKLEAARAQLLEVQARHRQTMIVAPAAGMVASRSVTIGQVIQTGTEMFRIIQDRRIEVDARVLETDLLTAAIGQPATILGPTGSSEQGIVRIVAPIVDPKTRLGTARIALSADSHLKPGMFARVEIAVESKLALTVPLKALVWREAKAHVFKINPANQVSLTEVGIGPGTTENVEVLRGLNVGDRIVTLGAGFLNDGDIVNVETASLNRGAMR